MMKRTLISVLVLVACFVSIQAQTQVIAHRGFWKTEGSAQNSITALEKAAEAKLYGSEFDVLMTSDGIIVVNHDNTINGMVISETPFKKLKKLKIKNGEKLPTLKNYLKKGKKLDIQLILETKPLPTKEMEDQAVATIVKMVKKMGLEKQVEYISFSLNMCEQLAKLTPESEIAYLNALSTGFSGKTTLCFTGKASSQKRRDAAHRRKTAVCRNMKLRLSSALPGPCMACPRFRIQMRFPRTSAP